MLVFVWKNSDTLKVILDKFFYISKRLHQSKFLQIHFLQPAPVNFLCKYIKKCYEYSFLGKSVKSVSVKMIPLSFYDQLILRFWIDSTTALQRLLSNPSESRPFVANRCLSSDNELKTFRLTFKLKMKSYDVMSYKNFAIDLIRNKPGEDPIG